ncbi:MAG: SRPBCC family protein [Armatimonadota bacterium]|nr:SRPBCC family protein [Armatimonadota bacterium]
MQFSHEASVTVDAGLRDARAHWDDIHSLPRLLSHLRGTAPGDTDDLARLVIVLDGRHIEFAVERTMCSDDTICWQSMGPTFIYLLSLAFHPERGGGTRVTVNVAYDPPGFLPDIAETFGTSKLFRRALESDLRRYAQSLRRQERGALVLAD